MGEWVGDGGADLPAEQNCSQSQLCSSPSPATHSRSSLPRPIPAISAGNTY